MRKLFLAMVALVLLWPAAAVQAQPWPSKPIKFMPSLGPGPASVAISRISAQLQTAAPGQPVGIILVPGASGAR